MNPTADKLELLSKSNQYTISKKGASPNLIYHVTDHIHDLDAIYLPLADEWDYGVIGIDSVYDYKSVNVKAMNDLVEFTRKLSENDE